MLEGVVEEMGSKLSPKCLSISTFSHSLWMWQGSGREQMARQRGANEVVTHGGISGESCGIMSQTVEATRQPISGPTAFLNICCSQMIVSQWRGVN